MKKLFLDIDGVLNTEKYLRMQAQRCGYKDKSTLQYNFDPIALGNLKQIIEATNANMVISSTWKLNKDNCDNSKEWTELVINLDSVGISDKIFGITPTICNTESFHVRWMEIKQWLQDNNDKDIENFVIIDDEWDMGEYTKQILLGAGVTVG